MEDIDIIVITHEHADHFHAESVREIVKNNPDVQIIANSAVGEKLKELHLAYTVLEGEARTEINGILIEAFDCKHEEIFEEIGQVRNTGYFIDGELFYPGDSYGNPKKFVRILALPVSGPWCKISDALRYALLVKPVKVFPVHDGMLRAERTGVTHGIIQNVLSKNGVHFVSMNEGDEADF